MSAKTSVRKMLVILTDLFSFILGQLIDLCVQNHSTLLCRFCYEFRYIGYIQGSHGLMDRGLDLKPEVTQGCWFKSRLRQEVSTPEVRPLCKVPQNCSLAPLGWVKCREHISLLIILCIIVYVTNKAHLRLVGYTGIYRFIVRLKTQINTFCFIQMPI